jgi:hypothetical protein
MKGLRAAKKLAKDAVDQASAAAADAAGGVANLRTSSSAHNAQPPLRELFDRIDADSPGRPGRLSGLIVSHSKSVLYGAFVWARRVLNNQKWRFPARAGSGTLDRGELTTLAAELGLALSPAELNKAMEEMAGDGRLRRGPSAILSPPF